jgi:hypothetical protein
LDSVVHAWRDGHSPEAIAEEFPTLSAEQIYGAIAFYLRHRAEVDRYLARQEETWKLLEEESQKAHSPLLDRLRANRKPKKSDEAAS